MYHQIGNIIIPVKSILKMTASQRISFSKRELPYLLSIITKEFIEPQEYRHHSTLFHFPVMRSEYMDDIFFEQYNFNYYFYMKEKQCKHHFDTINSLIQKTL